MLFDSILTSIDDILANYVEIAHTFFAGNLLTALRLIIIAYIAWYGISLYLQIAAITISELVGRILMIVLVSIFVMYWDWYVVFMYDFFVGGSQAIGTVLVRAANDTGIGVPVDINQRLGQIFDIGMNAASRLREQAGYTTPGPLLYAFIVFVSTLIMTGFGLFLLILSRMALALVIAVGPVFFLMLFFRTSRAFFDGWLRVLVNYSLVSVFLYALVALLLSAFNDVFVALETATNANTVSLTQIAPFTLICVVSTLLFAQVPIIAASIAGGPGLQTGGAFGRTVDRVVGYSRNFVRRGTTRTAAFVGDRVSNASAQLQRALKRTP